MSDSILRQSLINLFAEGVRGLVPPPSAADVAGQYVLCADGVWRSSGSLSPTAVQSVNGRDGVVVLSKSDVGLSNVDNTSDMAKPISTAVGNALLGKASKVHTHDTSAIVTGVFPPARLASGSALQVLRRDATNTVLEFWTPFYGTGVTRVVVANYTLDASGLDELIVGNASSLITVTLGTALAKINRKVTVKNKGTAPLNVTGSADEIFTTNEETTITLQRGDAVALWSDGTHWNVV